MAKEPNSRALSTDSGIVLLVAAIWLTIAIVYRVVPMINMPAGERVWGASAVLFLALMLWIYAAERRAQGPS